jgi:hypothetical protein
MNAQRYTLRDVTPLPTGGRANFLRTTPAILWIAQCWKSARSYDRSPEIFRKSRLWVVTTHRPAFSTISVDNSHG